MPEPVVPVEGWAVLHLFGKLTPGADGAAIIAAVKGGSGESHQVVTFAVLGHKADIGFMAIGPDLWRLRGLQASLASAGVDIVDSYLSVTEVSEYAKAMPEEMKRARLYPQLPPDGKKAFCFYPMSKRRHPEANWYTTPFERREALMREHGATGRTFQGRVVQLITASAGLDDYEWGVSLFARSPDDLKDVVYTMRFDEGSAVFAEFGRFVTGLVDSVDEVLAAIGLP